MIHPGKAESTVEGSPLIELHDSSAEIECMLEALYGDR